MNTKPIEGKVKVPLGTVIHYALMLGIGLGYENLSKKMRDRLYIEVLKSLDSLGEVEINEEDLSLIKENLGQKG